VKILLVIDGMHPIHGGPPAVIEGSARALQERGHDVTVLTTLHVCEQDVVEQTWASMLEEGVRMVYCQPAGLKAMVATYPDRSVIEQLLADCDVCHLHGIWNPILQVTARLARKLNKPYLLSTHGVLDHRAMKRVRHKWLKKRIAIALLGIRNMAEQAAAVIFGSEAEAAQSWTLSHKMRLAFVPNGVRDHGGPSRPSVDDMERLYRIVPQFPKWARTFLCFCRIHPEKGLDLLVTAFDRMAAEHPDIGILIAGLPQNAQYQAQVERMIAASVYRDRIVLTTELTGPTSHFLYQACDAYVLPSYAEGFSMALTEALANGKPALVTRYCHVPAIATARAGHIAEANVDSLADGLRLISALDENELRLMSSNARQLFVDNYTWSRVAVKLERLYQDASTGRAIG
jgi:glycosyltransferase involved in cell wall biosynthesis